VKPGDVLDFVGRVQIVPSRPVRRVCDANAKALAVLHRVDAAAAAEDLIQALGQDLTKCTVMSWAQIHS